MGFYRFQNYYVNKKRKALFARALSMTLRLRAKVLLHVWSYDFYDMTLSTDITATSYDKKVIARVVIRFL